MIPVDDGQLSELSPQLVENLVIRHYDAEAVAWAPRGRPLRLDGAGAVIAQLLDGEVTVGQLSREISEEVGIPKSVAFQRLRAVLAELDAAAALVGSAVYDAEPSIFSGPLNP